MTLQTESHFSWETIQEKLGLQSPLTATPMRPTCEAKQSNASPAINDLMRRSCSDGERTEHLTRLAGALIAARFDLKECIERCSVWNQNNQPPLDDDKVISTCTSISAIDQSNHPERYPHPLQFAPLFDLQDGRIDHYINTPPIPRRWLLKDLVVLGKVGAVVAPGGSSKSQWMLQLAVSVATGIPLAGHWQVEEVGGALMLCAEDDRDEIHHRLYRVQEHLRFAGFGDQFNKVKDRLFIHSTIGIDTLLTKKGASGEVSATEIVDRITALAKEIPGLRLIVIDPASRFRGGEENSNEDATRFVEALEKLAKQTGASIMLAHHTNKGSYNNTDVGQGASRGASALTDGLRWQMNLGRPTEKQATEFGLHKDTLNKYVTATVTKTNYSAIPAPVLLERNDGGYLSAVSPAQAKRDAEQQAVLKIAHVLSAQKNPISARHLEDHYGGVQKELKMSKQRVREMIKLGLERGYLTGGDRTALHVSAIGAELLRCFAPTADATRGTKITPHKKPKLNQ